MFTFFFSVTFFYHVLSRFFLISEPVRARWPMAWSVACRRSYLHVIANATSCWRNTRSSYLRLTAKAAWCHQRRWCTATVNFVGGLRLLFVTIQSSARMSCTREAPPRPFRPHRVPKRTEAPQEAVRNEQGRGRLPWTPPLPEPEAPRGDARHRRLPYVRRVVSRDPHAHP